MSEKTNNEKILKAFKNTNYGDNPNYEAIIFDTLLKLYLGFGVGRTSFCICSELNLIKKDKKPNKRGIQFMRDNYHLTGLR